MAQISHTVARHASGKLGSLILAQGPDGPTLRPRTSPRQSRSAASSRNRAAFALVSRRWRELSDAQLEGWNELGARLSRPGRLGRRITLSGQQAFASVNRLRAGLDLDPLDDAPLRPDPPPPLTHVAVTARAYGDAPAIRVSCAPVPDGVRVQVQASAPFSPGRTFVGDSRYRVLCVLDTLGPDGADIGPQYLAKFFLPAEEEKIAVRLVPISPTGFAGDDTRVTVRVSAPGD